MRKRWLAVLLVLISALTILASGALAQGRGRTAARARVEIRVDARDFDRRDRGVIIVRDGFFVGDRFGHGRPPGWDRGRKVGWGGCDLSPGLAKKFGCRSTFFVRHHPRRAASVRVVIPLR
jgi:hypothetical protein